MPGRIVIRVDASQQIGSGHVVRSLALAHELVENGFEITFVAREMPSPLQDLVRNAGHALHRLPPAPAARRHHDEGGGACAHWLRAPWQVDAEHTAAVIDELGDVDWLVIDHYAIDARWEKVLHSRVRRILVLDDLADRPHDCDLLVDQLVTRKPEEYAHLVPKKCRVLTGAPHALLRPAFPRLRPSALRRRQTAHAVRRLLVMLGGGTREKFLLRVLNTLAQALPEDILVDVAQGAMLISEEGLAHLRNVLADRLLLHDFSADIAQLIHDADMAVGACGMGNYERCCLGLPSIQFVQADNQRGTAEFFQRAGAALTIDASEPSFLRDLHESVGKLAADDALRRTMAFRAADLVDGKGARRIRKAMEET